KGNPLVWQIQTLLGFKGKDIDLDPGPSTRFRFQQLDDHPDAASWPGFMPKIDPPNPKPPATGPDTRPSQAMRSALSSSEREAAFGGPFKWTHAPLPKNKENIVIKGTWESDNIVTVNVPQLTQVPGNFSRMRLNKRVVKQTLALWEAWEKAGLLPLILSYEGAFVARLIRDSTTSLSNHAYGSAFDINYHWNKLGDVPAKAGTTGSVRELVPLAHQHGFFWGGNFSRGDGMHFEVCKVL
ncbi:MAG TPA: M15 family metallopeptidase, partial [Prosthecobacter sp.]|nr:M15 family metallopeptidase [Prosthecobacter sp.]